MDSISNTTAAPSVTREQPSGPHSPRNLSTLPSPSPRDSPPTRLPDRSWRLGPPPAYRHGATLPHTAPASQTAAPHPRSPHCPRDSADCRSAPCSADCRSGPGSADCRSGPCSSGCRGGSAGPEVGGRGAGAAATPPGGPRTGAGRSAGIAERAPGVGEERDRTQLNGEQSEMMRQKSDEG